MAIIVAATAIVAFWLYWVHALIFIKFHARYSINTNSRCRDQAETLPHSHWITGAYLHLGEAQRGYCCSEPQFQAVDSLLNSVLVDLHTIITCHYGIWPSDHGDRTIEGNSSAWNFDIHIDDPQIFISPLSEMPLVLEILRQSQRTTMRNMILERLTLSQSNEAPTIINSPTQRYTSHYSRNGGDARTHW